jgi:hypothetical protein
VAAVIDGPRPSGWDPEDGGHKIGEQKTATEDGGQKIGVY